MTACVMCGTPGPLLCTPECRKDAEDRRTATRVRLLTDPTLTEPQRHDLRQELIDLAGAVRSWRP